MDGTVVVAIPSISDPIWRVSTEKTPHLTLLFLGDQKDNPRMEQMAAYISSTANDMLEKFTLSVDHRGELGEDDADVFFFNEASPTTQRLRQFRENLKLSSDVSEALESVEQHPGWVPHTTLGWPATPAHLDPGIRAVTFDRIALWTGDSTGSEFWLRDDSQGYKEDSVERFSHTEQDTVDFLAHHGVKGMRWGVTKSDAGGSSSGGNSAKTTSNKLTRGERKEQKQNDKLDKKWEKDSTSGKAYIEAHNAMADRMNKDGGEIDQHNAKWKKAIDNDILSDPDHPDTEKYWSEFESLSNRVFTEEFVKNAGTSPSGTKQMELREDSNGDAYAFLAPVKQTNIKHAEGDTERVLKLIKDKHGALTRVEFTDLELKHYGVKGMKWGVTRDSTGGSASSVTGGRAARKLAKTQPVPVTTAQVPGSRVTASGGKNLPASEDAKIVAASRQTAKASTVDALSTKELQTLVTRLNLEQQYSRLTAPQKSKGRKFVELMIKNPEERKKVSKNVASLKETPIAKEYRNARDLGKAISDVRLD